MDPSDVADVLIYVSARMIADDDWPETHDVQSRH